MIDFIQRKTKEIMYNCMKRYATSENKDISTIQLVLGLNENGNTYTLCEGYEPKKDLTIMEVLNVRFDLLGYSQIAPPFILKSLVRFSEKHSFPLENSKVMCVPNNNDVLLFVYNDKAYVETITFADLFREEDLMPT